MTDELRGFAKLSPAQRSEIARRGGAAVQARGRAHIYTSDEARAAGHKGGMTTSRNTEHMREISRRGGRAWAAAHKAKQG